MYPGWLSVWYCSRNDISDVQKAAQRQKNYYSAKEIAEMERKLNEEFNLLEDRKTQSTFKPISEE